MQTSVDRDAPAPGLDVGRGDPTIVLVHGTGSSVSSAFAPQIARFSASHRVVGVDLPGHGSNSGEAVPATLQAVGERLAATLVAARVRAPLLVGHSVGAIVALLLADSGVRPRGVVAIDPPMLMPDGVTRAMAELAAQLRTTRGADTALRAFAEQSFFTPETPAAVRAQVLAALLATPPGAVAALLDATRVFDAEAALRNVVRAPTQVVLTAAPVEIPRLQRLLPHARIDRIEHTGHYSQLEQADALSDMVESFARGL